MTWGAPIWLHGFWLLAGLLAFSLWSRKRRENRARELIDPGLWDRILPFRKAGSTAWRLWWRTLAMAMVLLALARPQWGLEWQEIRRKGLDLVVALDTSKSMLAEDIKPNRLERAKLGLLDLLDRLKGDRVGLVVFAGDSQTYCPLTIDYAAFQFCLEDVRPGIVARGGTDLTRAMEESIQAFGKQTSNSDRVVVLISDGEDHAGDLAEVKRQLREQEIKVFCVGVGTPNGELIPMTDEKGRTQFMKDREQKVIKTSLDEATLQNLALDSGGAYVRAARNDFGIERLYDEVITKLDRDELETRKVQRRREQYVWFLGMALLCGSLESLCATNHRRKERLQWAS